MMIGYIGETEGVSVSPGELRNSSVSVVAQRPDEHSPIWNSLRTGRGEARLRLDRAHPNPVNLVLCESTDRPGPSGTRWAESDYDTWACQSMGVASL